MSSSSYYDSKDQEKAIDVLSTLVEENIRLKADLLKAHTFLFAQLLNSENGEVSFTDDVIRHVEDIEELAKYTGLTIDFNTSKTFSINGKLVPNRVWAWRQPTISNRLILSKEELLARFEDYRYKNEEK